MNRSELRIGDEILYDRFPGIDEPLFGRVTGLPADDGKKVWISCPHVNGYAVFCVNVSQLAFSEQFKRVL